VPRWPKGVLQALQAALASEGSPEIAANEAQLRTLCIRTELLTGLPTPATDQDLRRQYQMQQLLKGLGQGHQSAEGGIEALMLEWIAVGATTDAVYGELLPRAPRTGS
jgi:exonuclease SbcC